MGFVINTNAKITLIFVIRVNVLVLIYVVFRLLDINILLLLFSMDRYLFDNFWKCVQITLTMRLTIFLQSIIKVQPAGDRFE